MSARKTPLYERHVAAGGRMVDFAGYRMPVQYTGILDEHRTVRSAAGVFDVSHMGEVTLEGPRAAEAVQRLITNSVARLRDGLAFYTVMCRPDGGIVDDCIVYRRAADSFLIVINAANHDQDVAWIAEHAGPIAQVTDRSDDWALLALQGPKAVAILSGLTPFDLGTLPAFGHAGAAVAGLPCTIARTGYTGEDGFEIFVRPPDATRLWDALFAAGGACGLRPAGLGARDTLRLEARMCLYGNDIDDTTTPLEAGLGWVVKLDCDFIGREALARQKAAGVQRRLVGFVMRGRGVARHGYPIHEAAGEQAGAEVGRVTSGSPSPTLGQNIGLGYVPVARSEPGGRLMIDCRGKTVAAEVVKGPFYKRSY